MSRLKHWWPILLLALVPLLPLRRAVFAGETIGPFDQIRQMAPWNGPAPSQAWDVLQADGVLQFYGWRDLVFEAWGRGEPPYWNNYQLCGTPLMANSQSGAFYPPHILCGVLHIPTTTALTFLAWLHLFWAGLGVYLLARKVGATDTGAAVGGVLFSLSTFMLSWTALPSVVSTVAWIPWVLAGVWALQGREGEPKSALPVAGLAASVAMMLLAGHLQFAAFGLMAAGFLAVWLFVAGVKRGKAVVGALSTFVGLIIGLMLSAPQLVPVLQYSKFSHRAGAPTAQGYEAYAGSALKPFELTGLVMPGLLGDPTAYIPNVESKPALSSYWPQYVKPGSNAAETAVSLGPVAVLLLCFLKRRQWLRLLPVAVVGVLGMLIACGTPLTRLLYFAVPGWSATGSPGRAGVLLVVAACVGAAFAFDPVDEPADRKRYLPILAFGALAALSLFALRACGALEPALPQMREAWSSILQLATDGGAKLAALAAVVCVAAAFAWKAHPLGKWAIVAVSVAVPVLLGSNVVRTGTPFFNRQGADMSRRAFVNEDWGMFNAAHALMPPNIASIERIHDVAGYDSLLHRDTVALLRDIDGEDPAPPANGNILFVKPKADLKKLAEAGVTEVSSLTPLSPSDKPIEGSGLRYSHALKGPGRVSAASGIARIYYEGFDRLFIEAEGPGKLTLRDRNMPGWTATVDGKSVGVGGSIWREVELPEGNHSVVFRYTPPGLREGLALLTVGCVWLALLVLGRRWAPFGRRQGEPADTTGDAT